MESELISTPTYPTHLQGIVLHLARLAWLAVTLVSLGLFVSGLPARYNDIRTIYQGNIQVDLLRNPQGEYLFVTGPGSAATRAGVLDRDILLSIDGVSTEGLALEQIQGMLAGAVGSTVQLSVRTGIFPPRQVTVTRDSEQGRILHQFGLSTVFAALFVLASEIVFAGLCLLVAGMIYRYRSADWMALLASLILTMILVGLSLPVVNQWKNQGVTFLDLWFALAFGLMLLFFYLFPSGRFVPRVTVVLAAVLAVWTILEPFQTWLYPWVQPRAIFAGVVTVWLSTGALALLYRYRFNSNTAQKRQIRWIVWGAIASVIGLLIQILPPSYQFSGPMRVLYDFGLYPIGQVFKLMLPISISLAVLRYRLWDINLVINRVVVYTSLSAVTMLIYLSAVAALDSIFRGLVDQVAFFLATGLVALLFEPLRQHLQRLVNRLMYGERDDPYRVLTRLAERMEAAIEPVTALPLTVETIAHALKLPYVAILVKQTGDYRVVASYGGSQNQAARFPLTYAGQSIGELIVASRYGEESITPTDNRLLNDLARQISVTTHAVLLSADLERARLRIVETREEARRRLGSDLHDGVGHQLAGLVRQSERASVLLRRDPDAAQKLIGEIKTQLDRAILQVRQLAHQLYPPELELLGLVGAIQERLQSSSDFSFLIRADLPEVLPKLPTAIESAAYYIAMEALTNISKHAGARTCTICLALEEQKGDDISSVLELDICDDGRGITPGGSRGLGLLSMQARAAEVGGGCSIDANPQGGTCVKVRLPCPVQIE